jgi:flagellar basal body rod protein FlgB
VISRLFGAGTVTHALRGGLDEASATHRTIAERVANASQSSINGFAGELGESLAQNDEELTRQMAALADTQLRYEATARLLQKSYADLRTAIRDRG